MRNHTPTRSPVRTIDTPTTTTTDKLQVPPAPANPHPHSPTYPPPKSPIKPTPPHGIPLPKSIPTVSSPTYTREHPANGKISPTYEENTVHEIKPSIPSCSAFPYGYDRYPVMGIVYFIVLRVVCISSQRRVVAVVVPIPRMMIDVTVICQWIPSNASIN